MYNEPTFIKLVFLLADTQAWLDELTKDAFHFLPVKDKHKLARKTFYLSASALAHIIEKHYIHVNRHPQAGKFNIPVIDIIEKIKEAAATPAQPIAGSLNYHRLITAETIVGVDCNSIPVNEYTVITDATGNIITAFPGKLR